MKYRSIRALLFVSRVLGCFVQCEQGNMIYEFVATVDGRFDHWFDSPTTDYSIRAAVDKLGFWPLFWQILVMSDLALGRQRQRRNELIEIKSLMYSCHGDRELIADRRERASKMTPLQACQWLIASIKAFDGAAHRGSNRAIRVAGENVRAAAIELMLSLRNQNAGVSALLNKEFSA